MTHIGTHTSLLVVVHRCPVVPTQANRTAGTTISKSASLSTKAIIEMHKHILMLLVTAVLFLIGYSHQL